MNLSGPPRSGILRQTGLPQEGQGRRLKSGLAAADADPTGSPSEELTPTCILKRLSHSGHSVDPAEVASWWEERKAPRLLCGYHRLVARRPALRFSRAGFLKYLAGNIARGFAVAQFLREHANPLTDSTSLGSDEAEREG